MLKASKLSVYASRRNGNFAILKGIEFQAFSGEMMAVIGPSGCGKSTLLKAIAGLTHRTTGQLSWKNRELTADYDIDPEMLAYIPQFGIFHEELTVAEILTDAAILRGGTRQDAPESVREIAGMCGLEEILDREAKNLSGGQKRRLALAMELISDPQIILADEVTSGLDAKSSFEITVLLRHLAAEKRKIVLHVTHELKHLSYYDSILVLCEGNVAFHGSSSEMISYFQVREAEDVLLRLSETSGNIWGQNWSGQSGPFPRRDKSGIAEILPPSSKQTKLGNWMAQFSCLSRRRGRIFYRARGQLLLQGLLLFIFPGIVVLFALKGLPQIQNMSLNLETNPARLLQESLNYSSQVSEVGRLVSGLTMFQVILLALMGANNGAREIAAERGIFEKERLSGLNTSAYLASKVGFLLLLALAQSIWMTVMVKEVCGLPGNFEVQFVALGLVNLSLTTLSLAISSWSRTAEQASLIALYIVGFQLPLSGAVLALPDWLATVTRPFIAAYWGWSGYLQTLKQTRLYDLVTFAGSASLDAWSLCILVLSFQCFANLIAAFLGCYRSGLSE